MTEGDFTGRPSQEIPVGERAAIKRHDDHLRMDGPFQGKDIPEAPVAQRVTQKRYVPNGAI